MYSYASSLFLYTSYQGGSLLQEQHELVLNVYETF